MIDELWPRITGEEGIWSGSVVDTEVGAEVGFGVWAEIGAEIVVETDITGIEFDFEDKIGRSGSFDKYEFEPGNGAHGEDMVCVFEIGLVTGVVFNAGVNSFNSGGNGGGWNAGEVVDAGTNDGFCKRSINSCRKPEVSNGVGVGTGNGKPGAGMRFEGETLPNGGHGKTFDGVELDEVQRGDILCDFESGIGTGMKFGVGEDCKIEGDTNGTSWSGWVAGTETDVKSLIKWFMKSWFRPGGPKEVNIVSSAETAEDVIEAGEYLADGTEPCGKLDDTLGEKELWPDDNVSG